MKLTASVAVLSTRRNTAGLRLIGALVATRWHRDGLRRGDTLYFLGRTGKISHTAIYAGDGRYIESVRPAVRYTSFRPEDESYDARRAASFCFAKRLLE